MFRHEDAKALRKIKDIVIKVIYNLAPLRVNGHWNMISERTEEIARIIVNSAFKVHKELGSGLLERVYEVCLAHEISTAGLDVKRQIDIPIV